MLLAELHCTFAQMHTCTFICARVRTHTCTYICARVHTHTYVHTHAPQNCYAYAHQDHFAIGRPLCTAYTDRYGSRHAELITGNITPNQTAALDQCWAAWGIVTPTFWTGTSDRLPSHPTHKMVEPHTAVSLILWPSNVAYWWIVDMLCVHTCVHVCT